MKVYEQAAAAAAQGGAEGADFGGADAGKKDDGVVDADFEEVKDDKKLQVINNMEVNPSSPKCARTVD